MADDRPLIAIAGAGSIGAYVGGILAHQGGRVRFLGRRYFLDDIAQYGLSTTDQDGRLSHLDPAQVDATDEPAGLEGADMILVTVKSADTVRMADKIAAHAGAGTVVMSLQNGVSNAFTLRERLPSMRVIDAMVPFNVVSLGRGQYRRSTSGDIVIEESGADVLPLLASPALRIMTTPDIQGVLWGKLLMNLNNAANALSGLPLKEQLANRRWRAVVATMQSEALAVMKAAGIRPKAAWLVPLQLMPLILRLPTPLFKIVTARVIKIDEGARSSMWEDLEKRRRTEIDAFQGEIIRLAEALNIPTPICARVMGAIRDAEAAGQGTPHLIPSDIMA